MTPARLACTCLLVLATAGCGLGDRDEPPPTPAPAAAPAAPSPAAPAAAPAAPSPAAPPAAPGPPLRVYCGSRGTDFRPFRAWPHEAPSPAGFDPSLAEAVGRALSRPVVFVEHRPGMADPRIDVLEQGAADMVVATFSITPERRRRVSFTTPYYSDGPAALVAASSPYRVATELSAKRIVTVPGTTGDDWVRRSWPGARIVRPRSGGAEDAVAAGEADAYVNDRSNLVRLAARDPRLRVLDGWLSSEPWGIAVALGNGALLEQVDGALARLDASGELAALRARWLTGAD